MNSFLSYIKLSAVCICFFMLFAGLECNNNNDPQPSDPDEDKCGAFKTGSYELFAGDFQGIELDEIYSMGDHYASYSFSDELIINVCSSTPVELAYYVVMRERWPDLTFSAEIAYGETGNFQLTSDQWKDCSDGTSFCDKADINLDLQASFGTEPGWFKPILIIQFESTGNIDSDHEKLKLYVASFLIDWKYYEYKESGS